MTNQEAINRLSALQVMIEWDEPMCCAAAIDKAVEALEQSDKYRWHDLRKDPTDLPEFVKANQWHCYSRPVLVRSEDKIVDVAMMIRNVEDGYFNNGLDYWWFGNECDGEEPTGWLRADSEIGIKGDDIIAWREIEPFEEEAI